MSPIEHVWDLVGGWRLARDPRSAASKDELLLRIQAIWNSLSQVEIQNLFDSMPRRIATLIAYRLEDQPNPGWSAVLPASVTISLTVQRMPKSAVSVLGACRFLDARGTTP
ncbi:transposable element Tcb1 transposase [Trichonephila clavipes]|nr:transposable element Tcb1 transposase [Trichonephila clavipes]